VSRSDRWECGDGTYAAHLTTLCPDTAREHHPAAPHARELPPRQRPRRLSTPFTASASNVFPSCQLARQASSSVIHLKTRWLGRSKEYPGRFISCRSQSVYPAEQARAADAILHSPMENPADPTNQVQPTADQSGKRARACRFETAKDPYSKKTREQGSKKTV